MCANSVVIMQDTCESEVLPNTENTKKKEGKKERKEDKDDEG